jgi:hypothetical protein
VGQFPVCTSLTNYLERHYDQLGILGDMSTAYLNRFCLLTLFLVVSTVATGHAQTLPAIEAPQTMQHEAGQSPLCDPDSIDGTFTFADQPAGEQTVSLHFQNKGNAACRLHGEAGPSFAVDGHSMGVASCWLCDQNGTPPPAPERMSGNQIVLAQGERARLDLRWASTGESCQYADWVNFYVQWEKQTAYLFIPSEWPLHICSAVKSAGYRAEANSPSNGEARDGMLRVSVMPATVYSDEHAMLHVELTRSTNSVAQSAGCASLYMVSQAPSMVTRLDPLLTMGSVSRPSYTPEQTKEDKERAWPSWKKDHLRRCEIANGKAAADANIAASFLANVTHIEWRTAPAPGEDPVFLTAATHFSVLDVDTLAPNWGEPVEGIQAGLSVDRARFSLGERVPLHLRWENVNAAMPLAQGECKEPEPALEIQDSQHKVIQTIPVQPWCMGHGWGPFTIEKGKAQRTFVELTAHPTTPAPFSDIRGELPGPGVYFLVSVWSPRILDAADAETDKTPRIGSSGRFGKVYATARSLPVRVEVTSADHP